MWIFVLCVLGFAQGTLADVECSKNPFDECGSDDLFDYIPKEVAAFKELCPQFSGYVKCLKAFQDGCPEKYGHIFGADELYQGMYDSFRDLCKEGTLLNTAAIQNLRCLNETLEKTLCGEKVKAVTGPFRRPVENSTDEDDYTVPIEIMCLQDILESNCIAAEIGENCGQLALEGILELFRRTYYVEEICGLKSSKYLLKQIDEFNLDDQQKEVVIVTLEKTIIFHELHNFFQ